MRKIQVLNFLVILSILISMSCNSQNDKKGNNTGAVQLTIPDNMDNIDLLLDSADGGSSVTDTLVPGNFNPSTQDEWASYMLGISFSNGMRQQNVPMNIELFAKGYLQTIKDGPNSGNLQQANEFLQKYYQQLMQRQADGQGTMDPDSSAGTYSINDTIFLGNISPATQDEWAAYMWGISFASNMRQQKVPIEIELFVKGYMQASNNDPKASSLEEANEFLKKYSEELTDRITKENLQKGKAFLAENKKKKGVVETASGLQYKIIKQGTGPKPTLQDKVKCHYRGTLLDGTEFDSSFKRGKPSEFSVAGVIKGWIEGLQLMNVGSTYELYIPPSLAYGEKGTPMMGPNETLIFTVELIEIIPNNP